MAEPTLAQKIREERRKRPQGAAASTRTPGPKIRVRSPEEILKDKKAKAKAETDARLATVRSRPSLADEFVTGTASAFLPPEQDTSGGPLFRVEDIKNPVLRGAAQVPATNLSMLPVVGRASRRILEPAPLLGAPTGGKAQRIATGVVNELPNLARGVGEQIAGQSLLSRVMPAPLAAGVTGAAMSLADTGVPMSLDQPADQQKILQAGYGGFSNLAGGMIGSAAEKLAEGATRKTLARVLPQLPFDIAAPLGDVATSGMDPRAIFDPSSPEHEEALKTAIMGTVPSLAAYGTTASAPERANYDAGLQRQEAIRQQKIAAEMEAQRQREDQFSADFEEANRINEILPTIPLEQGERAYREREALGEAIGDEKNEFQQRIHDIAMGRVPTIGTAPLLAGTMNMEGRGGIDAPLRPERSPEFSGPLSPPMSDVTNTYAPGVQSGPPLEVGPLPRLESVPNRMRGIEGQLAPSTPFDRPPLEQGFMGEGAPERMSQDLASYQQELRAAREQLPARIEQGEAQKRAAKVPQVTPKKAAAKVAEAGIAAANETGGPMRNIVENEFADVLSQIDMAIMDAHAGRLTEPVVVSIPDDGEFKIPANVESLTKFRERFSKEKKPLMAGTPPPKPPSIATLNKGVGKMEYRGPESFPFTVTSPEHAARLLKNLGPDYMRGNSIYQTLKTDEEYTRMGADIFYAQQRRNAASQAAPLAEGPKPKRTRGGGGLSRRRSEGGLVLNPGPVLSAAAQKVNDAVINAGKAFDSALQSGKRALVERKTISGTGSTRAASYLMPNRGAGPAVAAIKSVRDGKRGADAYLRVAFEESGMDKVLDKATDQQLRDMDRLADDPNAPAYSLTAEQRKMVADSRRYLADLQNKLIATKALSKNAADIVNNSRGQYFRRFYRFHEDDAVPANLRKKDPALYRNAVTEFMGLNGINSRVIGEQRFNELITEMQTESKKANKDQQKAGAGTALLRSPFLQRKLENQPALRKLLGEYTGFKDRFSKTAADLSEEIVRAEFFTDLVRTTDEKGRPFAVTRAQRDSGAFPEYSKEVPISTGGVKQYGAAEGMFMRPHHFDALEDGADRIPGFVGELLTDFVGKPFNLANTAFSTGTLGANFVSGATLHSALSDSFIGNPMNLPYYGRAIEALTDRTSPLSQELLRAGAAAGVYLDEPISSDRASLILKDIKKELDGGKSPLHVMRKIMGNVDKAPGAKEVARIYNSVDLMFRYASVLKRLEKNQKRGMPRDLALREAVAFTNKFHPDYSKIPTFLKGFQKSGFAGPFLSYTFDLPRVMYNGLRHNPLKFAAIAGTVAALDGGILMSDEEEADNEKIKELFTDLERADLTFMKEMDGELAYLPMGRINPMASLVTMARNPDPSQYFLSSPEMQALIFAITGRDTRGRTQMPDDATAMEKTSAALKRLGSSLLPPITPKIGYEWKRIEDAYRGKADEYGRTQNLPFALAGQSGVRPRKFEADANLLFRSLDATRGFEDRVRKMNRLIDSERTSVGELEESIADIQRGLAKVIEDETRFMDAYATAQRRYPKSVSKHQKDNVGAAKNNFRSAKSKGKKELKSAMKKLATLDPNHVLLNP